MLDLFEALGDLYGNKCEVAGLVIKDGQGYSRLFQKWSRKLFEAGINKDDMRRGLKHLEEDLRDAARTDQEIWPCDYATFIGHCQKQKEREEYRQWFGLPKTKLKPQEQKQRMKDFRKEIGL